jgi:hypothetical protein
MLVTPGQPTEVLRDLVTVDGTPFDPAAAPTAVAVPGGRAWPTILPVPGTPITCTVRKIQAGRYAARVPAAVLQTIGPATIAWAWDDDGAQTATDSIEVTPVAVATIGDLARLPGSKAAAIPLQGRLRALSAATRDFETVTNRLFSPRLRAELRPYPGRAPALDDVLGPVEVTPHDDGTATYVYATGLPAPPDDVARAIAILASSYMADGPWDDRGYAITDDGGGVRLLTAGVGRAFFSIPAVEAAARRHRIPGFA